MRAGAPATLSPSTSPSTRSSRSRSDANPSTLLTAISVEMRRSKPSAFPTHSGRCHSSRQRFGSRPSRRRIASGTCSGAMAATRRSQAAETAVGSSSSGSGDGIGARITRAYNPPGGRETSMKTVMGDPAAKPVAGTGGAATWSFTGSLARIRDRLRPFEYPLLVIVAVGLVAAGQLVEDMADSSPIQMLAPQTAARRWTVIALVLYDLVIAGILSQTVGHSLESVRRVVKVDRATFQDYERRMHGWRARQDVAVLLLSGLVVTLLFWVLRLELLSDDPVRKVGTHLPTDPVSGGIVLVGYAVLGWASLRLLIVTVRLGRQLGRLSREPLEINVFDTTPLLPMGNIALAVALAPAGIIVLLLIGFGGS